MLGPVLLFIGYSLIYGAVANGGKFATDPWNGLFSDAYTDLSGGATGAAVGAALGNVGASVGSTPTPSASGGDLGSTVGAGIGNVPSSRPSLPSYTRPRQTPITLPGLPTTPVDQGVGNVNQGVSGITGILGKVPFFNG